MTYPDLDTDVSAYTAELIYIEGGQKLRFHGTHETFAAAASRAKKLREALMGAGEMGIKAHVGFTGERPADFPRNGVTL